MEFGPLSLGLLLIDSHALSTKGWIVFALHLYWYAVIELNVISIEKNYLNVDREGATYVVEFSHVFNTHVSIHIPIWCLMCCPVQ